MRAWEQRGHCVKGFFVSLAQHPVLPVFILWKRWNLLNPNAKLLYELWKFRPDCIYVRESTFSLFYLLLFIFFHKKIIIEINSSYVHEGKLHTMDSVTRRRVYTTNRIFFQLFYKLARGLLFVTKELSQMPEFDRGRCRDVVPNSINISMLSMRKQNSGRSPIRLFFLGSPNQPWHGVDKIISLAHALGSGFEFHIIGMTVQQFKQFTLPENMIFHGFLEDYIAIVARCHIAVGTLGLHRNNMEEACPLKTREYLAAGFPVILGYTDTAFPSQSEDFLLHLPNKEDVFSSPENVELVRRFCMEKASIVVPPEAVCKHIDAAYVEKKRLQIMEQWLSIK